MPWQRSAIRFMTALDAGRWRYPEVCIVVSRQNGKTEMLVPRIIDDLRRGRRVLHTAQNRTLPRRVFIRVAHALDPDEIVIARFANGQEMIEMRNGGEYMIVAPQRGARGLSGDTLIVDEIREFEDWDMMAAAGPILTASPDPQTIFLSNAGSDMSVVLNDLRRRADEGDPELAYVEWSADPATSIDDREGWVQANPALAFVPSMWNNLELRRRALPPAQFETEHLCRWVRHMRPRVVSEEAWNRARVATLESAAARPSMGIAITPSGSRVSVAMAWPASDGMVELEVVEDVTEVDLDKLGPALNERALRGGVSAIAYAAWTDQALARYLGRNAKALDGRDFANASVNFSRLVETGFLRWRGTDTISNDLLWLARKPHESGAWQAVVIDEQHPATAALAAIRAVWLASGPGPKAPRVF
jgi:hypothetical protein